MKFLATLILVAAVLVPYYILSSGTFYLPEGTLESLGFASQSGGWTYVTHLFTHVGLQHLAANLIPLIAFGLLLESVLAGYHILAIFLISGIFSSVLFTLINPNVLLIGASTGVSGLMAASTLLKPKQALVLLIATLLLLLAFNPLVDYYNSFQVQSLQSQKATLEQNVQQLLQQNKTAEAAVQNQSLATVQTKLTLTTEGIQRERETPTDFLVHMFGAGFGALYIVLFARPQLRKGFLEFESLGELMYVAVSSVSVRLRGRKKN